MINSSAYNKNIYKQRTVHITWPGSGESLVKYKWYHASHTQHTCVTVKLNFLCK